MRNFIVRLFQWFLRNSEKIHYLLLSIALLLGGVWTLYTFDILHQRDKAAAELKELQDRIKGTNASNIQINPSSFELADGNFGLIVNVNVQNTGTRDVLIDWSDEDTPLSVFKVSMKKGDQLYFEKLFRPKIYAPFDPKKKKKEHYKSLYLLVGAKKELSFYVELPEKGMYYITFNAKTDKKLAQEVKSKSGRTGEWFSSKYINIEPEKKPVFENYIKAQHVFAK
ncbi:MULTISPECIES: hypothetical protein [Vibrio]|uniref:hypothetical protein n=1 Tax=Vibrio TaxID=662 RepID=UPI000AB18878|nr:MULTISPECIES: hypothetical protein [Vibrio]HCH3457524.1 hypothetical protein [Vibrio parahaemolyticus]EMA2426829.1 hypothetical protein [Vibrio alginolyticus]MBS9911261.1 hypothetical protein [Vibrio alginolyticus]MBT0049097.1 hypothetical protein [Vibrio alginolyticus]MBT0063136.1 hypothetical protein [Vibrio alginolyticus]